MTISTILKRTMKLESLHATFVLTFFTNFHVALCQVVVKSLFKKKN